ncbi:MAG: hypothetical protein M3R36_19210 [Bacteroidota bacterium]|nr:hypothetical protein [Bacteroidota bacterium]
MNNNIKKANSYADTFGFSFSLRPLLKYWEKQIEKNKIFSLSYDYISEKLKNAPELLHPITDLSVIEKNSELIEELLNICISPAIQDHEFYAAVYANELESFYETLINNYKNKLDPRFGFIFDKRKNIEDSIMLINETISTELDIHQDKAQKIFPHYFEKYKTDGVEYNMYLGSSLVADKIFNQMHLKNLRLWQLVTMCIITKKCVELKDKLSVPLDTTHLIFVQNATLSINFLYDEKKFDVAGSYDIRHEIIKKKIDKAEIKGSKERLSFPGKIAIVYSQENEAEEYKQYINFLKTKNYISSEVEAFELADMQGIHGLKALRISVNSNFTIDKNNDDKIFDHNFKTTNEYVNSLKN